MKLQLSLFLLLKFSIKGLNLPFGYRIVHQQKRYTHLGFGFFVLVLVSLRFQKVYHISFLNSKDEEVKITAISKSQIKRYEASNLKEYKLREQRIWKK